MDILIVIMGMVFLGIIAALVFFFLKEPAEKTTLTSSDKKIAQEITGLNRLPNKKIIEYEEKIKKLANELDKAKIENTQVKEEQKKLLEEKSHIVFDMEQYEKFRKEHQELKNEILKKEELLEKEISLRRAQSQELIQIKQGLASSRQKIIETEDAFRKSQTTLENSKKTIDEQRKELAQHSKIVNEYSEKKSDGQWVAREEFNKIETELKEKEQMLQKLLSIKKDT